MTQPTPEQTESRRRSGQVSAKRWNTRGRDDAARAAGYGVLRDGDAACVHHWQIPTPDGPASTGRCRKCRGTMRMLNSLDLPSWKERGDITKMLADEYGMAPL